MNLEKQGKKKDPENTLKCCPLVVKKQSDFTKLQLEMILMTHILLSLCL